MRPSTETNVAPTRNEQPAATASTWAPGWAFYAAFGSLLVVTMAAALDATSLSVALPVSSLL